MILVNFTIINEKIVKTNKILAINKSIIILFVGIIDDCPVNIYHVEKLSSVATAMIKNPNKRSEFKYFFVMW